MPAAISLRSVSCFEFLTGRAAFAGAALSKSAPRNPLRSAAPSKFNSRVPPELDRINLKALAKEPSARYQSADELRADLRNLHTTIGERDAVSTKLMPPITRSSQNQIGISLSQLIRSRYLVPIVALALLVVGFSAWTATRSWRARVARGQPGAAQFWYERGTQTLRDGAYFQAVRFEQAATDNTFALAPARLAGVHGT